MFLKIAQKPLLKIFYVKYKNHRFLLYAVYNAINIICHQIVKVCIQKQRENLILTSTQLPFIFIARYNVNVIILNI